jgi:hypothetical protein
LRLLSLTVALTAGLSILSGSAHAASTAKVIRLLAVQQGQKDTSNGFVIRDNDFIGGKKAGRDTVTCKVVSQQKANCKFVTVLAGGTIKANLTIVFSKSSGQGTITGGTGQYAGAKGKLTFGNLNEKGTRTAVVLTLT